MAGVVVTMDGDEAKLYQAWQNVINQQLKAERGLEKVSGTSRKAAREQANLARAAKRVYDETRTPQERYNQKLRQLSTLLKQNKIDQDTYRRAVAQANTEMRNAGQTGTRAFGPQALSMLRSFVGALGVTGGVAGAVILLKKEYEALIETQQRAKDATMTVADAQIGALRNLGAETSKERDRFIQQIRVMSTTTGIAERDLYMRASAAASARGPLSMGTAMAAVRESALLVPESAEEGTAIAGAALDLAKISGNRDPRKNIGQLMAIGQMARVVNVGQLAENVAPALTGITARGDTIQQAGPIWAAITQGMADPSGRRSGTATIGLATQLAEFLPEETTYKFEKGVKQRDRQGTGLKSTIDRIRYLQQDDDERLKFLGQANFLEKARAPIEQMLSGKGATAEALTDFLKRMPTAEEAVPLYEKRLALVRDTEIQQTGQLVRGLEAFSEQLDTLDQQGAREAAAREKLVRILQQTGMGWAASKLEKWEFEMGADRLETFRGQIQQRRHDLLVPPQPPFIGGAFGGGMGMSAAEVTALERKQAEVLGALLSFLEEMKGSGEESNRIQRDQTETLKAINSNVQATRPAALAGPGNDPEGR